ncbi:MAG: response regulator, partial [Myxococcota bacterium]
SISGERYVLVRAASLSVEFFDLVRSLYADRGEEEAANVAKNFLYDMAHSLGKADARAFHSRMNLTDPIERLSAGPIHFAYCGWAFVRIHPESNPTPDENYYLIYDHPFSFESDAWIKHGRSHSSPVCIMNAAYSSGWCAESFGLALTAVEVECKASGDEICRFIMAPPSRIEHHLEAYSADEDHAAQAHRHNGRRKGVVPEYFQRKRLEDELRASRDALERRVRERTAELASANAELRRQIAERYRAEGRRRELEAQVLQAQKLESLGVLAGGIAHDFNNLLVGILGNASAMLWALPVDSPLRDRIVEIEQTAQRAAQLTNQLLTYAGQSKLVIQPVALNELIEELARLLGSAISKKADVRYDFAKHLPLIRGDPTQLRQVVMNLLINSSEALERGVGTITLRTDVVEANREFLAKTFLDDELPEGRYVRLEVIDTGRGMDSETLAKIFDPFFTTRSTGHGLGLAAVLGIVRGHDGGIRVESKPGQGTTFSLLFPARDGDAQLASTASTPVELEVSEGGTVLIVDDEEVVRSVSELMLRQRGFSVLTAESGREGLDLLVEHEESIVAVLLDVTMPGLDGRETLREIRSRDTEVPVVLMTGYAHEDVILDFVGLDYTSLLHKPFTADGLADAIRRAIGSSRTSSAADR